MFSEEIYESKMMTSNETCAEFIVYSNEQYLQMLEDWRENDSKVEIRERNLTVLNDTITSVKGNSIFYQLTFADSNDISSGGNILPDHLVAKVKNECILFKDKLEYSKEHKRHFKVIHRLRKERKRKLTASDDERFFVESSQIAIPRQLDMNSTLQTTIVKVG